MGDSEKCLVKINNISIDSQCPACGEMALNTEAYWLDFDSFRHLDFSLLGSSKSWPNILTICNYCGAFYRFLEESQCKFLNKLYRSNIYADHNENHKIYKDKNLQNASEAQADALIFHWPEVVNCKSILDIGCFDGKLLSVMAHLTSASRLVGYDVAERKDFPTRAGFEFHKGIRSELEGQFDLIILSQSLIYISDLMKLFNEFNSILSFDGSIFVHVPNSELRPSSLLLADQIFHFTIESLTQVFARHNFYVEVIKNHAFDRDILLLAKRKKFLPEKKSHRRKASLDKVFQNLINLTSRIIAIPANNIAIFGTTIEAAFTHSLIRERVNFFVDENPDKLKSLFNGVPVISPDKLTPETTCLVPMGYKAQSLVDRLSRSFPGHFILI